VDESPSKCRNSDQKLKNGTECFNIKERPQYNKYTYKKTTKELNNHPHTPKAEDRRNIYVK